MEEIVSLVLQEELYDLNGLVELATLNAAVQEDVQEYLLAAAVLLAADLGPLYGTSGIEKAACSPLGLSTAWCHHGFTRCLGV